MKKNGHKGKTSRRYSSEEKLHYVLKLISGASTMQEIFEKENISKFSLVRWKEEFFKNGNKIFQPDTKDTPTKKDRIIEKQQKEIYLLKKVLEHFKKEEPKKNHKDS